VAWSSDQAVVPRDVPRERDTPRIPCRREAFLSDVVGGFLSQIFQSQKATRAQGLTPSGQFHSRCLPCAMHIYTVTTLAGSLGQNSPPDLWDMALSLGTFSGRSFPSDSRILLISSAILLQSLWLRICAPYSAFSKCYAFALVGWARKPSRVLQVVLVNLSRTRNSKL
jgi:hypothetical protein